MCVCVCVCVIKVIYKTAFRKIEKLSLIFTCFASCMEW